MVRSKLVAREMAVQVRLNNLRLTDGEIGRGKEEVTSVEASR